MCFASVFTVQREDREKDISREEACMYPVVIECISWGGCEIVALYLDNGDCVLTGLKLRT